MHGETTQRNIIIISLNRVEKYIFIRIILNDFIVYPLFLRYIIYSVSLLRDINRSFSLH